MTNREIRDAYGRIQPDDAARERMLRHILSSAAAERFPERAAGSRRQVRAALLAAAILAAGLLVASCCYVTDFFSLGSVGMGPQEIVLPAPNGDGSFSSSTATVDMISLQGLQDSPEFQACAEWEAFLAGYDQDGSILAAIGNNPTGIPGDYDAYLCYTRDMTDKLDQLCEKYGLALLGPIAADMEGPEDLSARAGVGDVFSCGGGLNDMYWGYCYQDGTFLVEGGVFLAGPGWFSTLDYQFSRARKGSLSTLVLNIGSAEDFDQWTYVTENGVPLLLAANGSSKGLVIADREESFVVVNVLGDLSDGRVDLNRQTMESFAEAFDFSPIP